MINGFSQRAQEELKYYVYVLVDPRDNKIFYVGKGIANRVFSHINEAFENPKETDKLGTIRAIKAAEQEVRHYIVRHGLEEPDALLVESVLIDFLTFKDFAGVAKITNLVAGHHAFDQGIKGADECELLYNCRELRKEDVVHDILIININKSYDTQRKKNIENPIYDRPNIYEATRGWWVLGINRAKRSEYVLAEYKGVIRAVFKPELWVQSAERANEGRWGFEGYEVTDKSILDLYINKAVPKKLGMANPIRYWGKWEGLHQ